MSVIDNETSEKRHGVWLRGLIMLFFIIAFGIAQSLTCLMAIFQFLSLLITGEPNRFLIRFGRSLAIWISQVVHFLSCASEKAPFPWQDWPKPP